jgi:hypothetical protein
MSQELDLTEEDVPKEALERAIRDAARLEVVRLGGSTLAPGSLELLGGLPYLRLLDLTAVPLEGQDMGFLTSLGALEELFLSATGITDDVLKTINALPLRVLLLDDTRVTNVGVRELAGLSSLIDLKLGSTRLTNEGVRIVTKLSGLRRLDLSKTSVGQSQLPSLLRLGQLETLDLDRSLVTDQDLDKFPASISELSLRGTAITNDGVAHLGRLPKLARLDLSDTEVTGASVADLARTKSLTRLLINRTSFSRDAMRNLRSKLPDCDVQHSLPFNPNWRP